MIILSTTLRKRCVFLTWKVHWAVLARLVEGEQLLERPLQKPCHVFECFPYVCPEPVLANIRFFKFEWYKLAHKKEFFAPPIDPAW